jgi:ubiquinone/menaquinone biosynthesis C-methylase UbiE
MKKQQKDTFLLSEGNAWFRRNKEIFVNKRNDPVLDCIKELNISPQKVLEIGCSNGYRLAKISKKYRAKCFGIDPSQDAINTGSKLFKNIFLKQGTADTIDFNENEFDLVVIGFCLYLCDRKDLFKIAYNVDRVLSNKGVLIILDFGPPFPYKNIYKYFKGIYSFKMNYSTLFNWNPNYFTAYSKTFTHVKSKTSAIFNPDERVTLHVLFKDNNSGYPDNPFKRS